MAKKWTPEERKAFGDKMRKAREDKEKAMREVGFEPKASEEVPKEAPTEPQAPTVPELPSAGLPASGVTLTNEQFAMLLDRFSAMGKEPVSNLGVGITERFPTDASNYPSPVEGLYDLASLKRFGLRDNFVIDWKVYTIRYETRQGQWFVEPRFEIVLKKKMFDDSGEEVVRTDKNGKQFHPRIILGRASFFVDPPADMVEAELANLEEGLTDKELQDRMMFWRYANWLQDIVMPKKPDFTTNNLKEEVFNGRAYQIEDYSMPV